MKRHEDEECTERIRSGAPLAAYAIDRRCLRNGIEAIANEHVEAQICFMCACISPRVKDFRRNLIRWVAPLQSHSVCILVVLLLGLLWPREEEPAAGPVLQAILRTARVDV